MPSGMQKSLLILCSALLCSCAGPRASLQRMIIPVEQFPPGLSLPIIKPASMTPYSALALAELADREDVGEL